MHKVRTAPLNVVIIADGEDAMRLHKRVGCGARALGIELAIESQRANGDEPRVLIDCGDRHAGIRNHRRAC